MSMNGAPTTHFRWPTAVGTDKPSLADWNLVLDKIDEDLFRTSDQLVKIEQIVNDHTDQIEQVQQDLAIMKTQVEECIVIANTAKATADEALANSKTAIATANEAKTLAAHAEEIANQAMCMVTEIKAVADNALAIANAANATANQAYGMAQTALTEIGRLNNIVNDLQNRVVALETEEPVPPAPVSGTFNWRQAVPSETKQVYWTVDKVNRTLSVVVNDGDTSSHLKAITFEHLVGWIDMVNTSEIPGITATPGEYGNRTIVYGRDGAGNTRILPGGMLQFWVGGSGTFTGSYMMNTNFPITVT